jgi:Copper binding proteins, plastocyanin/azurin family
MTIGSGSLARLTALSAVAAAVLGAWAVAAGAVKPHHDAHASSSSQLQVTQVEYRLRLSSTTVRAGTFELTEIDAGREFHDLRLRRGGTAATLDGRLLAPGHRWSTTVRLSPGVYTLWCSLPEHARLGMRTTLRVTG